MTEEKICPACGKPTAGYTPCPHCGVDPKNRIGIKAVAVICVIALVLGSGYFAMHLATAGPQPILISSIDRWLDYAYVWVAGTVVSGPSLSTSSLSFNVQDSSGQLRIEVYDPTYKTLIAENRVPTVGDSVTVFGQLRVYLDGSVELRVSKPEDLLLTKAQVVQTSIQEVLNSWYTTKELAYKRVIIEGKIIGLRPLSSAKIFTLEDNSRNTIDLYVHNGLMYLEGRSLDLKLLQVVRVTVGVSEYGGTPQLALADYDDIEVIENQLPTQVSLEAVDNTLVDQFVKVSGEVVFVEMVGEYSSLAVYERQIWLDNQYTPRVILDEDIYKLLPDNTRQLLRRGSNAELVGRVSRSGATLRINLVGPPELSLQSGTYEPPLVENFANITLDNKDNLVKVEGSIVSSVDVVKGTLPSDHEFVLQDNFGDNIKLWVTNTVYERMFYSLAVGDNVRVVGKVVDGRTVGRSGILVQPGLVRFDLPSDIEKVS